MTSIRQSQRKRPFSFSGLQDGFNFKFHWYSLILGRRGVYLPLRALCIIVIFSISVITGASAACPVGCECSDSRMRCVSWAHAQPPEPDRATYVALDLSASGETINSTVPSIEDRCRLEEQQRVRRFLVFPCDAPPGSLGSALDNGFLPENWLGDNFGYLTSLSLRGEGICSMHRNALRPQARLTTLDLSANRLQWLNVMIIRKNLKLVNLSLADNPKLELPPDGTVLYSDSIKALDLSRCSIYSLPEKVFLGMPKLESVKLSGNCIHELSTAPLTPSLAPSLARLDLSANLVQGMATAGEDATALARMSSIELSDNKWMPGCGAVRSSGDKVYFANGSMTTWEAVILDVQCVVLTPRLKETTTILLTTLGEEHASDEEDPGNNTAEVTFRDIQLKNVELHEGSMKDRIIDDSGLKSQLSRWMIIASISMNAATVVVLIIVIIKRRLRRGQQPARGRRPDESILLAGESPRGNTNPNDNESRV